MTELPDLQLNKNKAAAALTPPARRLHLSILTSFVETGRPPVRADLLRLARDLAGDPAAVLAELADHDVVAFDAHGEIRAAYPFSPTPTAIQVTWSGGPVAYAMCAVDALGMSAMLGRPVTITATEPDSDRVVTVEVDGDHATWTPDTAVVFAGTTDDACCPSVDRTCGTINFFTSHEAARQWSHRHPDATGTLLDQPEALACGIAEFGALLRPAP